MKDRNTSLKCTWKNAVIWSVITAVVGLLYRYAVLWFCVPAQMPHQNVSPFPARARNFLSDWMPWVRNFPSRNRA